MNEYYQSAPGLPLVPPPEGQLPQETLTLWVGTVTSEQFRRLRCRPTRWLGVVAWALGALIGVNAVSITAEFVGRAAAGLSLFWLLAAGVLAGVGAGRAAQHSRRQEDEDWRSLSSSMGEGAIVAFSPGCVRLYNNRFAVTLPLDPTTRYTEYADMMVLEGGGQQIVLPAKDLAWEQAQAAYTYICAGIPAAGQYMAGRFAAGRQLPAPIPAFGEEPVCLDVLPAKVAPAKGDGGAWLFRGAALALVAGALMASLLLVTGSYPIDLLLFTAVSAAVAAPLGWLFTKERKPADTAATLWFTAQGLRVKTGGQIRFIAPADIGATRTPRGATVATPAGSFTVGWTDAKNRQQLEWLLFGA